MTTTVERYYISLKAAEIYYISSRIEACVDTIHLRTFTESAIPWEHVLTSSELPGFVRKLTEELWGRVQDDQRMKEECTFPGI